MSVRVTGTARRSLEPSAVRELASRVASRPDVVGATVKVVFPFDG